MKATLLSILTLFCAMGTVGQAKATYKTDFLSEFATLGVSKVTTENTLQTPEKQENPTSKKHWPNVALSPGVVVQRQTFGELNLLVGRYDNSTCRKAFRGVRFGAETNFQNGMENIWAPKIGLEFSGMAICTRATTLYYITDQATQWRFLPEIGISFLGFANLTYGYNFRLSGGNIDGMMNHRVCLSINLNGKLMKDVASDVGVFENRKKDYLPEFATLGVSKVTTENTLQTSEKRENPTSKKHWPDVALSPGVIFQKQTFGELNLLVGRYESSMSGNAFGGVRFGAETNFMKGAENIWAPKIGVELSGMVICLRATALYYVTDQATQWRLLPEIGISFLGFANLTYGYNFRLTPGDIDGMVNHRVCLSLNLNPYLMGDVFGF